LTAILVGSVSTVGPSIRVRPAKFNTIGRPATHRP
jgi:hypothetical protein